MNIGVKVNFCLGVMTFTGAEVLVSTSSPYIEGQPSVAPSMGNAFYFGKKYADDLTSFTAASIILTPYIEVSPYVAAYETLRASLPITNSLSYTVELGYNYTHAWLKLKQEIAASCDIDYWEAQWKKWGWIWYIDHWDKKTRNVGRWSMYSRTTDLWDSGIIYFF